jgi:hypothetical protein
MKCSTRLTCIVAATVLMLVAGLGVSALAAAPEEGFRVIFDGKTLNGWDGNPDLWRVEEGAITGETTKEHLIKSNTFLIWRGGKPADFELKAEFRMPNPGFANSGIQIRSWEGPEKWRVSGYQPDMDGKDEWTGCCYGENYRGVLAERGQKTVIGKDHKPRVIELFGDAKELAKLIKHADWNEYDIIAKGNHIIQRINGHLMCELNDEDTVARKDGVIALQLHAGPPMKVQFRNIRLKEFGADKRASGMKRGTRVRPPEIDPVATGAKAIEMFDTDKDGKIDGEELDKCPGLKVAIDQVDPGHTGITAEQIAKRIRMWQKTKLGRMSLRCSVIRNGEPLAGAEVKFVPEPFLGENMPQAGGKTDENGNAMLSVPMAGSSDLPGVPPGFYRVEITKAGVEIPEQYNRKTILGQEVALDAKGIMEGIRFNVDF